jgi:hypothetical protein
MTYRLQGGRAIRYKGLIRLREVLDAVQNNRRRTPSKKPAFADVCFLFWTLEGGSCDPLQRRLLAHQNATDTMHETGGQLDSPAWFDVYLGSLQSLLTDREHEGAAAWFAARNVRG